MSGVLVRATRHWPSCRSDACLGCRPAEGAIAELPIMRRYAPTPGHHWPSCEDKTCTGCRARSGVPAELAPVRRRATGYPTTRAGRLAVSGLPLQSGRCGTCGKTFKLRRDGKLRQHGYEIAPHAERTRWCAGSGREPVREAA